MRSMAELLQLKAEIGHKLADAELSQKPKIIVGMGTCGIAAAHVTLWKPSARSWRRPASTRP